MFRFFDEESNLFWQLNLGDFAADSGKNAFVNKRKGIDEKTNRVAPVVGHCAYLDNFDFCSIFLDKDTSGWNFSTFVDYKK